MQIILTSSYFWPCIVVYMKSACISSLKASLTWVDDMFLSGGLPHVVQIAQDFWTFYHASHILCLSNPAGLISSSMSFSFARLNICIRLAVFTSRRLVPTVIRVSIVAFLEGTIFICDLAFPSLS